MSKPLAGVLILTSFVLGVLLTWISLTATPSSPIELAKAIVMSVGIVCMAGFFGYAFKKIVDATCEGRR